VPWRCFSLLTVERGYNFVATSDEEAEDWGLSLAQCVGVEELSARGKVQIARAKLKLRSQGDLGAMLKDAIAKAAVALRIPFAWKV